MRGKGEVNRRPALGSAPDSPFPTSGRRAGRRGGRTAGPFPERYANDMQISACEPEAAFWVWTRSAVLSVASTLAFALPLARFLAGYSPSPRPVPCGTGLSGSQRRPVRSRRRIER